MCHTVLLFGAFPGIAALTAAATSKAALDGIEVGNDTLTWPQLGPF